MLLLIFSLLALFVALVLSRLVYSVLYSVRQKHTLLEVTPPAFADKSVAANETLFAALHGLGQSRSFTDKLLGRKHRFSVEISSTRSGGVRFFIVTPETQEETIRQLISSHVPEAKVKTADDYLNQDAKVFSLRQSKHFAYPIKSYDELGSTDPVGYVTSAMTKLKDGEQLSLQIVFRPERVREADGLRRKILKNEAFMPEAKVRTGLTPLLKLLNTAIFTIADGFSAAYHHETMNYSVVSAQRDLEYKKQLARGDRPVRTLSYFEHEVVESVNQKLKRPLFRADIRLVVITPKRKDRSRHKKALSSALKIYDVEKYQSLRLERKPHMKNLRTNLAIKRLLSPRLAPNYFAASELANLYHFPNSQSAKTENVNKSLSKTLPAPVSLKNGSKLDVLIGENHHQGQVTPIGLTEAERERHMYIIGGTGNGKTTMLKYQIVQDIQNGKGVAAVDPHGDLAEELLGYIPENRIEDVVYINPDDLTHPIGINLLELPEGLEGDDLLREKDLVTESTISVLRKMFSDDDSGGHRIEYVLRNTIQTALTLEKANLFTIFRLLNDVKYRKKIVKDLEDNDLKIFWKNELGKAGDFQRVKMAAGITAKIGRFLFSASAKRMLEQDKSTIDFDKLLDEKKIVICNFSKGLLGEDTSMLFGVTILAKLQLAALRRARQAQVDRSSFYLYVDEFQNFATMSFVQMLSEARKYKLFLVMAEQSTQQQDDQKLVDVILANVGTVIAFRSGSPTDERLILPLFRPYIDEGEISNLPAYNFYARIAAVDTQEPLSGQTVLTDKAANELTAEKVKRASQRKYTRPPQKTASGNTNNKARTKSTPSQTQVQVKEAV